MAGPSDKPEFPPLLPLGRHNVTLDDIQEHCVDAFPLSTTRAEIMKGLRTLVARLVQNRIECELWIDGSFLTQKIDADDCDLVLRAHGDFYDNATLEQRGAIEWVEGNLKSELRCDSYVFFEYEASSPNFWLGEYSYAYWMRQFGFSRDSDTKGIGVLVLDGAANDSPASSSVTDGVEPKAHENDPVA